VEIDEEKTKKPTGSAEPLITPDFFARAGRRK
jgi:hypothetical protein